MYMHKDGVEYYMAITGHFLGLLQNKENKDMIGHFIDVEFQKLGNRNTIDVLKELDRHAKKIHAHIEGEKTALKAFVDKIHSHVGTSITDPKTIQLLKIIDSFNTLDRFYIQLKDAADTAIIAYENLVKNHRNMQGDEKLNHFGNTVKVFKDIHEQLTFVYRASQEASLKLKNFIIEMKKESELIKKEEQVAEDFEKNLMSWF